MNQPWYFILGFVAQILFSLRVFVQWVLSEKAKKVVSPAIYWQLSLLASIIFSIYGWLRGDFAIILGQFFTYYIYIWNLKRKNRWIKLNPILRYIIIILPVLALIFIVSEGLSTKNRLFDNISLPLLVFGSVGQIIFTLRFIYQWWYSRSRNESILPSGFWILSLAGATITIIYGVFRRDPVLIIGHGAGFFAYARNLWLSKR